MPYMEFEEKTVDKAISTAIEKLKITKEKLKYDVISHGASGIFGLVRSKKAKIRVLVPQANEGIKSTAKTKDTSEENKSSSDINIKSLVNEAFNIEVPNEGSDSTDTVKEEPTNIIIDELEAQEDVDAIQTGQDALFKIASLITTNPEISIEKTTDHIIYQCNSDESGVLIGKKGKNLEAIQYIVEKIVNKKSKNRLRILIDVEGYLGRRQANLKRLAKKLADKAKQTGKTTSISQMNSHERRTIHLALKDDHNVKTQSIGNGYYRKLVIVPKKKKENSVK